MLLIVPFGPNARPRFCVLVREDFADWAVFVESIEGARSAASEAVVLRPRAELVLLGLAELLPATIFNAQLASEDDEDLRADASPARSWLLSLRRAGAAPAAEGGTKVSFARGLRGGFALLFARDRGPTDKPPISRSIWLATDGALLLFLLVPAQR